MKIKNIKTIGLLTILTAFSLGSCSDNFLAEKTDYSGVNEQVFQDASLAGAYVDYIYKLILPPDNAASMTYDIAVSGDAFSKTTDELVGETAYNKTYASLNATTNSLPYLGTRMGTSIGNNTWTRLRQINIFLNEVDKYSGIEESKKNQLKGQLYFWRAWQYFDMVKLYGGVPLVLTAQNPILDATSNTQIPRSSTSACIEQIVADLDMAKSLLPGKWPNADWGRITSGAAAAFKGRVLLTWASPLFNPNDDTARWQRAYDANLAAKTLLESNGSALFVTGGTANGKAWGDMWFKEVDNSEAVIVYGFNNSVDTGGTKRNNGWEKACRSKETTGGGSISPTKQIADSFPMVDGTSIVGNPSYNPVLFYKGRDPRFYKTFAYNGATWAYNEKPAFKQWTYSYTKSGTASATPATFTETLGANSTAIYLCKATSPSQSNSLGYVNSGTDFMEMRFAEVVLNLAESAIGINKLAEGKDLIRTIRVRAGIVVGSADYGLAAVSSRDQHFAAVLNERKIELAYEGKRFYDLRRWKLFDASAGTCARLGFTPLNGTRRTGYYFIAKNTAGARYVGATDPFLPNAVGVATIVSREPASFPYVIPATGKLAGTSIASDALYLEYLYTNYFEIVERNNIEATTPANWTFKWYNEYDFFGIPQTLLDTTPYLEQNQAWGGTFDPLK